MTFAIAAAGTGGHVFPGLAVGQALVDRGVDPDDVLFVGGSRLESTVYPEAGFPFLGVELAGLQRSLTFRNLRIPVVVVKAVNSMAAAFRRHQVDVVLGLGGYVTVPAGLAARRVGAMVCVSEQNAEAGLANRLVSRISARAFGSFPSTKGIAGAEWVGNPVRRSLAAFDRQRLRPLAIDRWGLDPSKTVVGVFGGSLGAGVINDAVVAMMAGWSGPPIQLIHIAGHGFGDVGAVGDAHPNWHVEEFIDDMDLFFAASDLVIARAGGSVAELTATGTPSVLVPGGFGSGGHQESNAAFLEESGAAVVVREERIGVLGDTVAALVGDPRRLRSMAESASSLARPNAADTIAAALQGLRP